MSSAAFALQQAIFARLAADGQVTTALGGARIYDDVPVRSEFPYVTFGQSVERDWSGDIAPGHEHMVTLHAWSRGKGRKEADVILVAVQGALHDAALTLSGHRLVNLRHEFSETRRDADGDTFHGIARFRAVTEVV